MEGFEVWVWGFGGLGTIFLGGFLLSPQRSIYGCRIVPLNGQISPERCGMSRQFPSSTRHGAEHRLRIRVQSCSREYRV